MDTELAIYDAAPGSASAVNLLKCHTDVNVAAEDRTSLLSIQNTVRGRVYSVQVGSQNRCANATPCYDTGDMVVSAEGSPRPANDDRAAALALPASHTASTGNMGATLEPAEDATCGSTPFSATVWFRWTAPAAGVADFDARASFANVTQATNSVLAVYRAGDGTRLGCNDDASEFAGPSRVTLPVAAGDAFLLQIGAYGPDGQLTGEGSVTAQVALQPDLDLDDDGAVRPGDCNDADARIRPGASEVLDDGVDQDCNGVDGVNFDRDRDGVPRPLDCDDGDPGVRPGAADKPRNRRDEDCSGRDARWPRIPSRLLHRWATDGKSTTLVRLEVREAVAGAVIKVRCKGRGCPFKRWSRKSRKDGATVGLLRPFRGHALSRARIRVDIVPRRAVAKRYVLTTRSRGGLRVRSLCIEPRRKPKRC
jgi:hypothetical protein